MTVYNDDYIRPAEAIGSHLSRQNPEGASNSCKRGAPLGFSSGYMAEKTSGAVTDIAGFALEDGHSDSSAGDSNISYTPVETCNSWVGILSGAVAAHTLAQTDLGTAYGLAKNSAGIWFVDAEESSSSQKCVTVTKLLGTVGDDDQRVEFTLNKAGNPYYD